MSSYRDMCKGREVLVLSGESPRRLRGEVCHSRHGFDGGADDATPDALHESSDAVLRSAFHWLLDNADNTVQHSLPETNHADL